MGTFGPEIGNVMAAVARAHPNHQAGVYAIPWYLVIGEPGSGRTTAVRSMNLTWPPGDGPLPVGPQAMASYWMASEAVIIEPETIVLGPGRNPQFLSMLCQELKERRPREPLDGILLVINLAAIIDLEERGVESYGNALRKYLVEVSKTLGSDVPVYIVFTHYDTMWGFAEVFQWTPERKGEEAWGFVLPGDTPSQQAVQRLNTELDGLAARFEAFCLAKLSSEDPPEHRTRAFQHLVEVKLLMTKLRAFLGVIAMANAFERAPWVRALIVGSAFPGTGDRLRAGVARFSNMGLVLSADPPRSMRPGGLPLHSYMKSVVLPEKDLVPTRTRWRDDKLIVAAALLWVGYIVAMIVVSL
jgi:type VI protein secretion system component VasK